MTATFPKHIAPEGYIPPSRQQEPPQKSYKYIGQNLKRVEDPRLLTGRPVHRRHRAPGMAPPRLRSDRAHARIKRIDTSKAKALAGVYLVLTGAEAKEMTGATAQFASPPVVQYCLAVDRVRHVGEAVAAVVAENRYIAEDACDLIEVEYQDLPVVVDPEAAMTSSGDAVLHPERGPNNIAQQRTFKFGPVEDDFAKADVVVKRTLRWGRSGAQPLETVGCIASHEPGSGKFTMHEQLVPQLRRLAGRRLARRAGVEAQPIPCVTGGSFGSDLHPQGDDARGTLAARPGGR
jgi:CO/xanthine dehydrogenase Mo-binding subunit